MRRCVSIDGTLIRKEIGMSKRMVSLAQVKV